MYNYFAKVYDTLMEEFPYDIWEKFVYENFSSEYSILDIGCGTGNLLKLIEKNNYFGIGLDISNEMLTIAKEKCKSFDFYEYDIKKEINFKGAKNVSCFVDSINYILDKKDVTNFFKEIYNCMDNDSKFLIDFHTIKKINEVFVGHYQYEKLDNFEFEWESIKGEYDNSCIHKMKFYEKDNEYSEEHIQISFGKEFYIKSLEEAGFVIEVEEKISNDLRIFLICNKK